MHSKDSVNSEIALAESKPPVRLADDDLPSISLRNSTLELGFENPASTSLFSFSQNMNRSKDRARTALWLPIRDRRGRFRLRFFFHTRDWAQANRERSRFVRLRKNNCGNEVLPASFSEIFERSLSQKHLAYHPYMTDNTVERRRAASMMARAKRQNLPKALLTMSQFAAATVFCARLYR